ANSLRRLYVSGLPAPLLAAAPVLADARDADVLAAAPAAVAGGPIAKTSAPGFSIEKKAYSEQPAEGALPVGFDLGLGKFVKDEQVYALRPLYRTAQGDVSFQDYGVFRSAAEPAVGRKPARRQVATRTVRLQANPGYAVGAITLRTGVNIRGMSVTFMRVNGQGLNPQDSYTSDWLGDDKFGREASVSGHGAPIVGVFGNQDDEKVLALGLYYIKSETAAAAPAQAAPA